TPVADRMPGVEIHAQLLENIFDADLLARPRGVVWAEASLLLAGGLLLILVMPRASALASAALYALMVAAIVTAGALLYLKGGVPRMGARPLVPLDAGGHARRDRAPPPGAAPPGRAAARGGGASGRRARGRSPHPDGQPAGPDDRVSGRRAPRPLCVPRAGARGRRWPLRLLPTRTRSAVPADR